ncbi:hypothetical protein G9A89_005395 [Geosiphon pyriformis]|nr:hypothetical protein G9A89_005395 [Geosiphon pyriformis]
MGNFLWHQHFVKKWKIVLKHVLLTNFVVFLLNPGSIDSRDLLNEFTIFPSYNKSGLGMIKLPLIFPGGQKRPWGSDLPKASSTRIIVKDPLTIEFLGEMAMYARSAICDLDPNKLAGIKVQNPAAGVRQIISYFSGPGMVPTHEEFEDPVMKKYPVSRAGLVNHYWYTHFERKKPAFKEMLKRSLKPSGVISEVVFTGFGLGGVYAMFAALEFSDQYPTISSQVVTFGSPRPGNAEFVRYFNSRFPNNLYRVVKLFDFATSLPRFQKDYRHPHFEYLIVEEKNCDCYYEKSAPFKLFKCLPNWKGEESNNCNKFNIPHLSQDWLISYKAHTGPYFGTEMKCDLKSFD